ncbi:hypothetical protein BJX70DRAFT_363554 [Aspergillus crustosus]
MISGDHPSESQRQLARGPPTFLTPPQATNAGCISSTFHPRSYSSSFTNSTQIVPSPR